VDVEIDEEAAAQEEDQQREAEKRSLPTLPGK